ncbi:hypothetical protein ACEPAG_21 [Sanghuangporus baumii]
MTPQAYPFSLVNAFSGSPFGGNPAVVIILDAPFDDSSLYLKVARNFNQPMACFVFPVDDAERESEPDNATKTFRIRWFTISWESEICGHGTLAAAHALLSHPKLVPEHIRVLRFKSMHGYVYARRIRFPDAPERIEIELPAFDAKPVENEEFDRIRSVVCKAFSRDVKVIYIGIASSGEGGSEIYLLIELDENEALEGIDTDTAAFAETSYRVNIVTVKSRRPDITYETRMFAPLSGVQEDHVCGSANCLMAPYWANKLGIAPKREMIAKQVSARGGDLWVYVDRERRKVCLQGVAKLTAAGQVYI